MDGLRWLLLLLGIIVVAGVYLYSRRQGEKPGREGVAERRVPPTLVEHGPELEVPEEPEDPVIDEPAEEAVAPAEGPQKIVTLRLVARDRGAFPGDELVLSLRGIGMRHGKFGIFHRYDGNDEGRTIFSAASLVEPGSFDMADIKNQKIPGISLFLVLPAPIDAAEAFDMMMEAARTLAQSVDAELLDETGSNLSIQRERYMREEIIEFQRSSIIA